MADNAKFIESSMEKLNSRINNFNPSEGSYENENKLKEIEQMFKNIEDQIDDLDNEIQEDSKLKSQRPLINKMNQFKEDLEIMEKKFNDKKEQFKNAQNIELLKEGKLSGAEKIKTERDMIENLHKETDIQGNIITSIGANIKDANRNLVGINEELKNQGEQINRIGDHVKNAENEVKASERLMTKMERRAVIGKVMGIIAIIAIALFNITAFTVRLINRLKPKKEGPNNKGTMAIFIEDKYKFYSDFKKIKNDNSSFVIIKAGEGKNKNKKLIDYFQKAYEENIKLNIILYWISKTNEISEIEKEANMAIETIKDIKFKYPIYYYISDKDIKNMTNPHLIADKFCSILQRNNFVCGIYSNKNNLDKFKDIKNKYKIWISDYTNNFILENKKDKENNLLKKNKEGTSNGFNKDIDYIDFPIENKN